MNWINVGVHPTPHEYVNEFCKAVVAKLAECTRTEKDIRVLDACAGDGRLGVAVCSALVSNGYLPSLVLVETRRDAVSIDVDFGYPVEVKSENIFDVEHCSDFNVVISNPPYEHLSMARAEQLGLKWEDVSKAGRNLYGLVMSVCIDMCAPGGVCAFIAPQGWIRNVLSSELREYISTHIESLSIYASTSRTIFPGVVQDTAIQIMSKRSVPGSSMMRARISYDRGVAESIAVRSWIPISGESLPRVRIGPLVWNRHDPDFFSDRSGIRVIYGGMIDFAGDVNWTKERYSGRRKVLRRSVPSAFVSRSPFIMIKRVMRGSPGAWVADVFLSESALECVAENHVVVVELSDAQLQVDLSVLAHMMKQEVEVLHKDHGHPNVSVGLVREAVSAVIALLVPGHNESADLLVDA